MVRTILTFCKHPFDFILYKSKMYGNGCIVSKRTKGIKHLILGKEVAIPEFCTFAGLITIGDYTTLGIHNMMYGNISIGKYCQIGAYVAIHGTNHPITHPSIYINYRLFNGELSKYKISKPVAIGNDVWIGHAVIILGGVSIGDGAIIGAGSVVTKDVEPYSIVGGNPAKRLRKRFDDQIIKELQELKWWKKTPKELDKLKALFHTDLTKIKSIYEIINK